jgi:hypothetical protein
MGKSERHKRIKTLQEESDRLSSQILSDIRSYKPIGRASELGEILGVKPKKGVAISTPMGTMVFAKQRAPPSSVVESWYKKYQKSEKIQEEIPTYSFGVIGHGATIGNISVLKKGERLKKMGLLDKDEQKFLSELRKFWQKHPSANTGVVGAGGKIEPFDPHSWKI